MDSRENTEKDEPVKHRDGMSNVVKMMISDGLSVGKIVEETGYSVSDIENIRRTM